MENISGSTVSSGISPLAKKSRIKVFVRVRPPNEKEQYLFQTSQASHCVQVKDSSISITKEYEAPKYFQFDHVFGEGTSQQEIFSQCSQQAIEDMFEGYHDTLFTYGETVSIS